MRLDEEVQHIFNLAYEKAKREGHEYFTPEHILQAMLAFDAPRKILRDCGTDVEAVKADLDGYFDRYLEKAEGSDPVQTEGLQKVIEQTLIQIVASGKDKIGSPELLVALSELEDSYGAYYLRKAGLARVTLLEAIFQNTELASDKKGGEEEPSFDEDFDEEAGLKKRKNKVLEAYTTDLIARAEAGELEVLIGREDILERTMQVLSRRLKNNPIHVGDPGVGKTAITEGLAQLVVLGKVPPYLRGYRIYSLDMGSLLAGTRYRGDFEERMKKVLAALDSLDKCILFIDEIHTIIGAGAVSGGSIDASNLLKPVLMKGKLKVIGSTTYEEFHKYFEKDHALARRFQRIDVLEPPLEEAYKILEGLKQVYEEHHGVLYGEGVIKAAVDLSSQYMNEKHLPDKAIDLMDESGAWKRLSLTKLNNEEPWSFSSEKKSLQPHQGGTVALAEPPTISVSDIEKVVAMIARIPERTVSFNEIDLLKHLEKNLKNSLFGQDEAVEGVVQAIKRSRAGFRSPNKPVACFLFVGPTGVGKTELARSLALEMGIPLHRFDMSEYQEKHTVSRLIGSPPGYVGYEEGGLLTDAIRNTPHAVLLLDEIEKAHQDIYNILLQMMDYATITDSMGRKADFRNIIIIMTSNAGARDLGKSRIGFVERDIPFSALGDAVERIFAPEFRNRLDKVIHFEKLDDKAIEAIVCKEIEKFKRMLTEKNVVLTVSEEVIRWIVKTGYSPEFGARNIARVVENEIKTFFVDAVLFGELANGGSTLVEIVDGKIRVRVLPDAQ